MKHIRTLAALVLLAASTATSHAKVVATTSFETIDGFSNSGVASPISVTSTSDNALWQTGPAATNYNGIWSGDAKTGTLSAVIGNAGHFLSVDPDGADGVTTVEFSWDEYTNSSGTINVDWSTDGTNWTTAGTITLGNAGANGYGSTTMNINQTGDVKIRWILDASASGGASIDDVTVNAADPPSGTHHKLFILTGQSNSLGVTNGGETDPTSGADAADAHVLFAWHNRVNASTSLGHSGQTLTPATSTADFTTYEDQQGGVYSGSATHWGPETEFARTLYRAGVRDFGVIKVSRGGGGNTFWHKGSSGHMYSRITTTVAEAVASLPAGDTYEIVGLLYLQGESDSSGEAAIAGTRAKELVDNLRSDLANASSMHMVIGGISASGSTRDTVRANHASIATSTSYIDYFETIDQQTKLHDGLHFNKEAKITVGQRYAQAFFSAGIVSRHYGKLVFIGDSITQGGNGDYPSYRYDVFKNLANQGVPINASAGYKFVGSVNGAYANSSLTTPDINGQTFENNHDGHFGWRAFWENGRIDLPSNRYNRNNLGQGTIENWTGQTTTFNSGTVTYTGSTYTPDTAVIMIGINDIASGSSATVVRDDIALMVDQLQAANADINIFLSQTLHTNQSHNATVDTLNSLLPALAASKTTTTSSVWVIETNTGFDPVTQTYDNVHPDDGGEEYVGDRISGGLGIIEMPEPPSLTPTPPVVEKGSASLTNCFDGDDIWNTTFQNGWSEDGGAGATESLVNTDELRYDHTGSGSGTTLNGTSSTLDGGATTWQSGNTGNWTFETRIKFNECSNGVAIWAGIGSNRVIVEIYADRTQDNGGDSFNVAHNNEDGAYHVYRIAHDADGDKYHVWRDGERLTPNGGADYDLPGTDNRLLIGDYTSGSFGNNFNIDIDYICYDQTGAYLPTGADADSDGMPDSWEYLRFGDIASAAPGDDADQDGISNLDEYKADTDPNDANSRLRIESIEETASANEFDITVPDTSPQRNYTLYSSTDLVTWTPVAGQGPIIGTDGNLVFTHITTATIFYRVEVTIP